MSVLLLRLAGPMQSWGTQSRFTVRDTGREPSKSGVVGMLCSALGRRRSEPLDDLAALTMAVRVDREGRLACDYHTAIDVVKADDSGTTTVISNRYYLADAEFLVALAGDRLLLEQLDSALRAPVWPLFLGRKAFVPGDPIAWKADERPIRDDPIMDVLQTEPWRKRWHREPIPKQIRYVLEVAYGQGEPRQDQPESLSFVTRRFALRHVEIDFLPNHDKGLRLPPINPMEFGHVPESLVAELA